MTAAIGVRVKSGYGVAVALRGPAAAPSLVARRVLQLCDPENAATKQPYHDGLFTHETDRRAIARRVRVVEFCADRSVRELVADELFAACRCAAIVVGSMIDPETVGNPHIRAHASEGRLFRTVLQSALEACGVKCTVIVEKELGAAARARLNRRPADIARTVTRLGEEVDGPWRADEKAAAAAAWMLLR